MIIWVGDKSQTFAGASGLSSENRDDHLGLWDCGTLRMSRKREGRKRIQVGQENLDGMNRMDRRNGDKNAMIIWVCGTVGLWDSCGRLNDPRWRIGLLFWENEMIIWVG